MFQFAKKPLYFGFQVFILVFAISFAILLAIKLLEEPETYCTLMVHETEHF